MKKIMFALLAMFVVQEMRAQDFVVTQHRRARPQAQVVFVTPRVDGAVPRAVRLGNPLQMLNPYAPREYGEGDEFVSYTDRDPFQGAAGRRSHSQGIKVLSFEW